MSTAIKCLGLWVALGIAMNCPAQSVSLRRTPVLSLTLPAGVTFEVQSSSDGGTWVPTGVILPGTGGAAVVRMDGFPEDAAYRANPTTGTVPAVTASVSHGNHLSARAPAANEIRFDAAASLAEDAWTHLDFAFPDARGAFRRALRETSAPQQFFRALKPAAPLSPALVTYYATSPSEGAAGFGLVADDMPQLYRDGFVTALCSAFYHREGLNAAAAGECYELAGPYGSVTVMVSDLNPFPPPDTCETGRNYFDLGTAAFAAICPLPNGLATATHRQVPAPVTGNIKMVVVQSAGGFYFELRPYNYRAGITNLQVRGPVAGGTAGAWTDLPRTAYNSFVYSKGAAIGYPFEARVTSRFGETVNFEPIAALSQDDRFTANGQFLVFPQSDPKPIWPLPRVYSEGLESQPGAAWSTSAYNGAVADANFTLEAFAGQTSLRLTNLSHTAGVILIGQHFPVPAGAVLEFAIKSATGLPVEDLAVAVEGLNVSGGNASSPLLALPAVGNQWRVMRIPLGPAQAPPQVNRVIFKATAASSGCSVLLDSMAFLLE